jgi:LPS O-antigen subunit length determinant protein (WzzB/FepE family)
MPSDREKRKRDKDRLREVREKAEKQAAREHRVQAIKSAFPTAEARAKEALKCPCLDYPEMDGADVQSKLIFFDISQHMYYTFKRRMDAALVIESAQATLDKRIQYIEDVRDGALEERLQEESALFSAGDSAELRARILDTLHVRMCVISLFLF